MPAPPALVEAVAALNLQPRRRRWTSLTYCIIDAVWSIGANYDTVVMPVVRRVAAHLGDQKPTVDMPAPMPPDAAPLPRFMCAFNNRNLIAATNRQRTSSRGGILKADAVLSYARIFQQAGIKSLAEATDLLDDFGRLTSLDRQLRCVPGDGTAGIRRSYLWMLIGDDYRIKPDRMVLRWLADHGARRTATDATPLLKEIASHLTAPDTPVTPWMVDHAIWEHARTTSPRGAIR